MIIIELAEHQLIIDQQNIKTSILSLLEINYINKNIEFVYED